MDLNWVVNIKLVYKLVDKFKIGCYDGSSVFCLVLGVIKKGLLPLFYEMFRSKAETFPSYGV